MQKITCYKKKVLKYVYTHETFVCTCKIISQNMCIYMYNIVGNIINVV